MPTTAHRAAAAAIVLLLLLAACSASPGTGSASEPGTATTTSQVTPRAVDTPTVEPTPTPVPTPTPLVCAVNEHISLDKCVANTPAPTPVPVSYAKLTQRAWQLLVKAPDNYTGNAYQVWGCISQFDAATGTDTFRAQASYTKVTYWYSDADNALFTGDETALADFVESTWSSCMSSASDRSLTTRRLGAIPPSRCSR